MSEIPNKKRKVIENHIWALILTGPLILGLIVFYAYPFLQNFFNSFTNLRSFGSWDKISFDNYIRLFQDKEVLKSFKNTFVFSAISVPATIVISMVVAQLLNNNIKGKSLYRLLYFLPAVTMPAAVAMIWKWIFNGQYGLLNQVLIFFNIEPKFWVSDPKYAMIALIIVGTWSGIGMNIIYFLAGLQTIPRSYYEAAEMDGASSIRKFMSITIPLLSPTIFFVTITTFIKSIQMFDLVFMLISRDSSAIEETKTIVYVFYQHAFEYMDKGYASAISIAIFLVILIITGIQLKLQKKWVHY